MHRLLLLSLLGSCPAQGAITGIVYAPDRRPLTGAEVVFLAEPAPVPAWLAPAEEPAGAERATSGGQGQFRIPTQAARGCLWVRHASGAGALVFGVAPGAPERVETQPCGEVVVENDLGEATAAVAATRSTGPVLLGCFPTRGLRLPPGEYRLLVRAEQKMLETVCRVASGRVTWLPEPTAAVPLDLGASISLVLDGFAVSLPRNQSGAVLVPRGTRRAWILAEGERGRTAQELWLATTGVPARTVPPQSWMELEIVDAQQRPVAGAAVWSLEATPSGPRETGRSQSNTLGRAAFLSGCSAIAVHAKGCAWTVHDRGQIGDRITLQSGSRLTGTIETRDNDHDGLAVELAHGRHPWLRFMLAADRRGRFACEDVPEGAFVLTLHSQSHRASRLVGAAPARNPILLVADPGANVEGRVLAAGGTAAAFAVVTLRDTGGEDGARRTIADAEGRFRFTGLDEEAQLTLSASIELAGQTWSTQLRGVQPGAAEWLLQLRLEDPPPPQQRAR